MICKKAKAPNDPVQKRANLHQSISTSFAGKEKKERTDDNTPQNNPLLQSKAAKRQKRQKVDSSRSGKAQPHYTQQLNKQRRDPNPLPFASRAKYSYASTTDAGFLMQTQEQ